MLGRILARRLGLVPRRRVPAQETAAEQIVRAANLPEVDFMVVDREIALRICHRKVIGREF